MTCITLRRLVLAGVAAAGSALAGPSADEPLEPAIAFPVAAAATADGIDLSFRIADGYYLYADRIRLQADAGIPVGAARIPSGESKEDPFVGRTRVLRGAATLHWPFTGPVRPGPYGLTVTAQGCAEDRVCYAPFAQRVQVTIPGRP